MKIIRRSSFTPVPWKNGGGVTHEALRVPAAAVAAAAVAAAGETFRWRVSVADIASSGPFSDFSGYHRILVLLRGGGVRLRFAGGDERELRHAGEFVEFDGGRPTESVLLNGPCSDLNLMVSSSLPRPHAVVEPVTGPRELSRGPATTLVFAITGTLLVAGAGDEPAFLGEGDLGVLRPDEARCIRPAASTPCLVFFATLEDNSG